MDNKIVMVKRGVDYALGAKDWYFPVDEDDAFWILEFTEEEEAIIERAFSDYETAQILIDSKIEALEDGHDPDNGQDG